LICRLQAKPQDAGERVLHSEAAHYSSLLSRKLEQLDICYRYRKSEKDLIEKGVRRVTFNLAVVQPDAIWLRIDTSPRRFPRGVGLAAINRAEVLNDLSVTAERVVKFKQSGDGAWLVIERETGVFGIRNIEFNDMLENWPQNKKEKELLLPFGLTHNRRLIFESLVDFPHVLIGGATQSGKTTLTHAWICALVAKNTPSKVRLVLVDLKGGVEYTRYKTLPHLWNQTLDGFIKNRNDVIPMLALLREEMDGRLARMEKAGGLQTLTAWNHYHKNDTLPRIVVFIDELASLMLEPDLKKEGERLLADIGARGRAPGIHLILATQRPEVSVVSGRIKGNIDARICFRVPDNTSSMVILDDITGSQFPEDTPRGRYIYKFGNTRREIQGPWIGPGVIKARVAGVMTGDNELQDATTPDPEFVFGFALDEFDGAFPLNRMYKAIRGKGITKNFLAYLAREYEGQLVEIRGEMYILTPPGGEFEPRRLVKATDYQAGETTGNEYSGIGETQHEIQHTDIVLREPQEPPTQNFTTMEAVLEFSLKYLDGAIPCKVLYKHFRNIQYRELVSLLSEYQEGVTVAVNGKLYVVEPSRGNKPRRLKLVE
jgi:hypothetical protein